MIATEGNFAIIGLGLIGGSLARDLSALGANILGWDADPATLRQALAAGVVQQALSPTLAEVAQADTIIVATPVVATPAVLATLREHAGPAALITDVGSTKLGIEHAALSLGLGQQFVGGHPLAGDHRAGWSASREGLFAGARVVLCPPPAALARAVTAAVDLWRELGAQPLLASAAEHDRHLAWTSHLPQATAFLLAGAIADSGTGSEWLGPGGRDTLRLAASPPDLWAGIALENAENLRAALASLRRHLAELEQALAEPDRQRITELFETGRRWYRDV